jgi:hypothetical protein
VDGDVAAVDKCVLVIVVGSRRRSGGGGAICYAATSLLLRNTLFSQHSTPATHPTINASYSPNTPTTRHRTVDADDDTLLVAVTDAAADTSASVADEHASKQSTSYGWAPAWIAAWYRRTP